MARVGLVFAIGFVATVLLVLVWHNLRENDGGVVYVKVTNRASQPLTRGILRLVGNPSGRDLFDSLAPQRTSERRLVPRIDTDTYVELLRGEDTVRTSYTGSTPHGSPLRIRVVVFDDRTEVSHMYR